VVGPEDNKADRTVLFCIVYGGVVHSETHTHTDAHTHTHTNTHMNGS